MAKIRISLIIYSHGGALTLADLIMKGICHGGGLHHALEGRANGFCVYNDVAITAKYLNQKYGQRY